jgi:hypothetical protein
VALCLPRNRWRFARALPEVLATDALSPLLRGLLARLRAQWQALDVEIAVLDRHRPGRRH